MYATALASLRHGLHVFQNNVALIDVSAIDDLISNRASAPHAHARFGGRRCGLRDLSGGWFSLGRSCLREASATDGAKGEKAQHGHSSSQESSKHKSSGVGTKKLTFYRA